MNRDQEIRRLFDQALDVPSDERTAWLDKECDDPAIRDEVQRLLKHDPGTDAPESPPGLGTALLRPKLPPKTRIGDYEIVRELGRGSMGAVYLAREVSLDRLVALKIVVAPAGEGEALLERFRREARMLAKLDHRGIVPVHRVGEVDGRHFIAMAYIPGETLGERLARERSEREEGTAVPTRKGKAERERDVARLLADVAEALDHAHRAGVIHRDVKPSNIMIDEEGQTHLMDFGIARDLSREGLTIEGAILGTCRYMSPEQARAAREEIDARSDVFSLGVVLYEAITLQQPFGGETVDEILGQVIRKEPKRLRAIDPDIPKDLDTIVHKAMEKERRYRYQSAAHLAADLRSYLTGAPILAQRPAMIRRARDFVSRRRMLVGMSAMLAAGMGIGAYIRLTDDPTTVRLSVDLPEYPGRAEAFLIPITWVDEGALAERRFEPAIALNGWPVDNRAIPSGVYRLVVVRDDSTFIEYPVVAEPGAHIIIQLRPNILVASKRDMVRVGGGDIGGDFWMDRTEVSNQEYREFLSSLSGEEADLLHPIWWSGGYSDAWDPLPVVGVTWEGAVQFAAWVGARLPTAEEWSLAAGGPDGWKFPWGDELPETRRTANVGFDNRLARQSISIETKAEEQEKAIAAYITGVVAADEAAPWEGFFDATPDGILHLYGNVLEWTESVPPVSQTAPRDIHLKLRVFKGKSWASRIENSVDIRIAYIRQNASIPTMDIGFRCARSARLPPLTRGPD